MEVTAKWIHKHKTKNGGWTRSQLAAIDVPWPPPKGWIGHAIGLEISESARLVFERDSALTQAKDALFASEPAEG